MIVKNYAGDVMNFDMAADLLRGEGYQVESVLIADDVAVESSLYSQGRRGTGTTVLAEKILGAAAERGYDLQRLAALGRRVAENGRSMGMALTSCTVPHVGKPTFELGEDEMEIGIGIHGEPGRYREPLKKADEIVERLMEPILKDLPFKAGDRVICMVNSMGGTPLSELYIVYRKVAEICEKSGIQIVRNLVGAYITSLEMAGTSITLLRADDEMLELWDHPVKTPALRWGM
jgi:dihydroxyacetone kinase-like protein